MGSLMINIIVYNNRVSIVRALRNEFGVAVSAPVWLEGGKNSQMDVQGLEREYGGDSGVVVSDLREVNSEIGK
jgi:hypothetical protein